MRNSPGGVNLDLTGLRKGADVQRVLVLEDDNDLRSLLCDMLLLSGAESCVSVRSFEDLRRQQEQVPACGLALLDVNLGAGRPSGLDAYQWLRENGFTGHTVFLTGHARSHPVLDQARALANTRVMTKPVGAKDVMALVRELDAPSGP
ncbi:response regulator [Stigmatella sp. ncwal1]|uniref:Response regulator n=1 Tax=Stigmatella ashevillensis TaxID=2995309 RepID=A0ABT5DD17_9BACT|nr:response regulator [Stigmatella ashevillena]MDC0711567.1 response regulator [Stigmatella ashevillena]